MNTLLASDLHLTDAPRDSYRWGLFPWMRMACKVEDVRQVILLGDVTDAKDFHSSRLVNRIVDELAEFAKIGVGVTILRGNHDGIDPDTPYFRFLSHMENVDFISKPTHNGPYIFLPHSKNLEADWRKLQKENKYPITASTTMFLHATVGGCKAENGMEMKGTPLSLFDSFPGYIYAGDIHVPQKIGPVEYVGSPYPVRFGDTFDPRCLLLNSDGSTTDLLYPCLRRHKLIVSRAMQIETGEVGVRRGDQVKVVVQLQQRDALDWEKYRDEVRQTIEEAGAELCGLEVEIITERKKGEQPLNQKQETLSDTDLLRQFAVTEGLAAELLEIGESLLEGGT